MDVERSAMLQSISRVIQSAGFVEWLGACGNGEAALIALQPDGLLSKIVHYLQPHIEEDRVVLVATVIDTQVLVAVISIAVQWTTDLTLKDWLTLVELQATMPAELTGLRVERFQRFAVPS